MLFILIANLLCIPAKCLCKISIWKTTLRLLPYWIFTKKLLTAFCDWRFRHSLMKWELRVFSGEMTHLWKFTFLKLIPDFVDVFCSVLRFSLFLWVCMAAHEVTSNVFTSILILIRLGGRFFPGRQLTPAGCQGSLGFLIFFRCQHGPEGWGESLETFQVTQPHIVNKRLF